MLIHFRASGVKLSLVENQIRVHPFDNSLAERPKGLLWNNKSVDSKSGCYPGYPGAIKRCAVANIEKVESKSKSKSKSSTTRATLIHIHTWSDQKASETSAQLSKEDILEQIRARALFPGLFVRLLSSQRHAKTRSSVLSDAQGPQNPFASLRIVAQDILSDLVRQSHIERRSSPLQSRWTLLSTQRLQ